MYITIKLSAAALSFLSLLFSTCLAFNEMPHLPTAAEIEKLGESSQQLGDDFFRKSFPLSVSLEYAGRFINPANRQKLHTLAGKTSRSLQQISDKQLLFKTTIEEYEGSDWDRRYGKTGLWRKLSAQLVVTGLDKCCVDFYLAIASDEPAKTRILQKILTELDSINSTGLRDWRLLLKAKICAALCRSNPIYTHKAEKLFDKLTGRTNLPDNLAAPVLLEKLKFIGPADKKSRDKLASDITAAACPGRIDLIVSLAFLLKRYDADAFEKVIETCPEAEFDLSLLLLNNYSEAANLGLLDDNLLTETALFEAELIAQAARGPNLDDHKKLFDWFCQSEKFHTPLLLYTAASAKVSSEPAEACRLFMKASNIQQKKPGDTLDLSPADIARDTARLAYMLFSRDGSYCPLAIEAFENYIKLCPEKTDPELEYLYTRLLDKCNRPDERIRMLEKIAERQGAKHSNRARLELTVYKIRQKKYKDIQSKADAAINLAAVIESCEKCEFTGQIMQLLSEIIGQIDICQHQLKRFPVLVTACEKLARLCCDCIEAEQEQNAGLYLAEILIFTANKEKMSSVEPLLERLSQRLSADNPDLLRCRARLSTTKGYFGEAAVLWKQICDVRKTDTAAANERTLEWWRAKYYQLYCLSKTANTDSEKLAHTIDVLLNSYDNIPAPWDKKLRKLIENLKK